MPAEVTSFVGRQREIAEVKRLLSRHPLVTLTGMGGVGKTRVALRVARELRRSFTDGVWLVQLAGLDDRGLVAHTVAETLKAHDNTGREVSAVLADHLRHRRLLLVLDSCEHLVDACARLVEAVLAAAPGLRVLVTSRQPLRTAGEHVLPIPPLTTPNPERPLRPDPDNRYPAVTLFATRAAAATPDFELTSANWAQVATLCHRLDGIPLAIELAAVRVRALGLRQILDRLQDRYQLLITRRWGGSCRHRALLATVEWSYDLCTRQERLLWARASVFAGSFDLRAAEVICSGDGIFPDEVSDAAAGLVEKSVLTYQHGPDGVRYRMLETLRQFGADRLAEDEERTTLRRRHRDWFLRVARSCERDWFGQDQEQTFRRTHAERDNLRAALEFCLTAPGQSQIGLGLAGTLCFYWVGCGFLAEGRRWLDRALALDTNPSHARAKALWVNGYVCILQGDFAAATPMLRACLAVAKVLRSDLPAAYAVHRLGCIELLTGNHVRAQALFGEAIRRYAALGELNSNVIMAWIELAMTSAFRGDLDEAVELCLRTQRVCLAHGERWAYSYALYVLAFAAYAGGDLSQAIRQARECVRINHTFRDLVGIVLPTELLALLEALTGAADRAAVLQGAARTIWSSVGLSLFGSKYFNAHHDTCTELARSALGDAAYEAGFRRGAELTLDEAIAYALGDTMRSIEAAAEPPVAAPATPLTKREFQVAELIADGLSNKDIAGRLFIAVRTAEGHVAHILTKLGFTSRAQVAAWVNERRPGH
ncbi:non-specific serine/threonine protein kinase [Kutzneria buriramensis]|uniref:Non-specific serine/threonine protein kinase n=2 Tax=Kutzneria buriramensis TaxID=1045776 RepID=A0A3E0H446_9PSEU|nr:non-specific serine/threonine protein kinase [Kutzneria buriramensis]